MKRTILSAVVVLGVVVCHILCTQATCPTVRRGSRGNCVKKVQKAVKVQADGIFGPNTERAVKSYQKSHRLSADGIVGPKTWNVINGRGGGSTPGGNSCGCTYERAKGCTSGPAPGGRKLRDHLVKKFGKRTTGIFNCRKIAGTNSYSTHAEGRAVDYHITPAQNGKAVFDYLVRIACEHGIQEVIFNRKRWSYPKGTVDYRGKSPHTDHVHVSLNKCGAKHFTL